MIFGLTKPKTEKTGSAEQFVRDQVEKGSLILQQGQNIEQFIACLTRAAPLDAKRRPSIMEAWPSNGAFIMSPRIITSRKGLDAFYESRKAQYASGRTRFVENCASTVKLVIVSLCERGRISFTGSPYEISAKMTQMLLDADVPHSQDVDAVVPLSEDVFVATYTWLRAFEAYPEVTPPALWSLPHRKFLLHFPA